MHKKGTVLTIGVFDGTHRGHQKLIHATVKRAHELNLDSILLSFDPHPMAVFAPESLPPMLSTFEERKEYAHKCGITHVEALAFDSAMAAMSPQDFIEKILIDYYNIAAIYIGANFTFGYKAQGNPDTLARAGEKYGFEVHVLDLVDEQGKPISSTRIRAELEKTHVSHAAELLGRPYAVGGVVTRGAGRGGKELGFPTANFYFPDSIALPADGVYCGWFRILKAKNGEKIIGDMEVGTRYPAAISIGANPTFNDPVRSVEAHIIGRDADLYDSYAEVEFIDFLRFMKKFSSIDSLLEAIKKDIHISLEKLKVD